MDELRSLLIYNFIKSLILAQDERWRHVGMAQAPHRLPQVLATGL